jgi:uncharacterized protein (DUF488 family)
MRIWSIGHGARAFEDFVRTLASGGVERVADVRSFPGSRRHPQFGRELFAAELLGAGVEYAWLPALGGRRRLGPGPSPNPSWRVEGFRAYADYMDSEAFQRGLDALLALAAERPTAFLCAETHWSRCHRRLLADALWVRGHDVVHLLTPERAEPHRPTAFVRVDERGRLRYDLPVDEDGQAQLDV